MRSPSTWTVVLLFSCLLAWFVVFTALGGVAQLVVIVWFLGVCPGMMLARYLRLREPVVEWTLAISLSLVADVLAGGLALLLGKWSPSAIFSILVIMTVIGALLCEVIQARVASQARRAWR
jgi:hypothetical protein